MVEEEEVEEIVREKRELPPEAEAKPPEAENEAEKVEAKDRGFRMILHVLLFFAT